MDVKLKKPFALLLGGKHPEALLELHDLKVTFAADRAEAFQNVANAWFGSKDTAHVDAYLDLSNVDGHELADASDADTQQKLFFINVGSYQKELFNENHHYFFMIGKSLAEVKTRAKSRLKTKAILAHTDNLLEIDQIIPLEQIDHQPLFWKKGKRGFKNNQPKNGYWPL
jgi:hypothetical protein